MPEKLNINFFLALKDIEHLYNELPSLKILFLIQRHPENFKGRDIPKIAPPYKKSGPIF
jgi:hypothetical protein